MSRNPRVLNLFRETRPRKLYQVNVYEWVLVVVAIAALVVLWAQFHGGAVD